jgi:hypothetical protein
MKVIKTATCKSLTAKSTLTYQFGTDEAGSVHIRITKNTGGGYFSNEWIRMDDVRAVLEGQPAGTRVTSFMLQPLFQNVSANNCAFLLAILLAAKLAYPVKGKKRHLAIVDSDEFTEKVSKLVSSKATTKKTTAFSHKKTVSRKVTVKKKATARKKTARMVRGS